jgi:hypothetical protein
VTTWTGFLERYWHDRWWETQERWEAASEEERVELVRQALLDAMLNLPEDPGEEV